MFMKRHSSLYNNICDVSGATYCEVGTWKGASFISAMYNNNIFGYVIDNWSEFGGPINDFNNNINTYFKDKSNTFCHSVSPFVSHPVTISTFGFPVIIPID